MVGADRKSGDTAAANRAAMSHPVTMDARSRVTAKLRLSRQCEEVGRPHTNATRVPTIAAHSRDQRASRSRGTRERRAHRNFSASSGGAEGSEVAKWVKRRSLAAGAP
jgi:hypothetical protein